MVMDVKDQHRTCDSCGAPIHPLTGECQCSD